VWASLSMAGGDQASPVLRHPARQMPFETQNSLTAVSGLPRTRVPTAQVPHWPAQTASPHPQTQGPQQHRYLANEKEHHVGPWGSPGSYSDSLRDLARMTEHY